MTTPTLRSAKTARLVPDLSQASLERIIPDFDQKPLEMRLVLRRRGERLEEVVFPLLGVASMVSMVRRDLRTGRGYRSLQTIVFAAQQCRTSAVRLAPKMR